MSSSPALASGFINSETPRGCRLELEDLVPGLCCEGVILSFGLRFPRLRLRFLQISRVVGIGGHILGVTSGSELLHQIYPDGDFEKHPSGSARWWRIEPLQERTTVASPNSGSMSLVSSWCTEITSQNELEKKNLSPWPRFKTILLREDERTRKRPSSRHQMQTQRWPASMSHSRGFGNWCPYVVCRTWQRK